MKLLCFSELNKNGNILRRKIGLRFLRPNQILRDEDLYFTMKIQSSCAILIFEAL